MKWFSALLGGQKWRVDIVKGNNPNFEGDNLHGITLPQKCRVYVRREDEETVREDVTLHELFGHAAFNVAGVHVKIVELCGGDEEKAAQVEEDMIRALVLVWHPLLKTFGFRLPKLPGSE